MTKKPHGQPPAFELRCGDALHMTVTVQRIPRWLVTALSVSVGGALVAWYTSR